MQNPEMEVFHNFLTNELKSTLDADYAEIIFHILQKDHTDLDTSCEWAVKAIDEAKPWLNPGLIDRMLNLMNHIAAAYPPSSSQEQRIIKTFVDHLTGLSVERVNHN